MERTLSTTINSLYTFSQLVEILSKVEKGHLSENYIVGNDKEKFFLKKYRFPERERIEEVHRVKRFFAERGIPVILPRETSGGETFFEEGGSFYALFPFVYGRELIWEDISSEALRSCGALLAKIHLQSKGGYPDLTLERPFAWNRVIFLAKAEAILAKISQESIQSEFSVKAENFLKKKIALVEENRINFEDFGLKSDHLIHGDFHRGNIFFSEDDEVRYLFDWEKANTSPRALELARAIEFFSFYGRYAPENYLRAKEFLQAYNALYPIDKDELERGLTAWYLNQVHNIWILEEHYLKDNSRVDEFLENQIAYLEYQSEHLQEHISKLQSFLK